MANSHLETLMRNLLEIMEEQGHEIEGEWSLNYFQVPGATMQELHMLWLIELEVYYIGPEFSPCIAVRNKDGSIGIYFLIPKKHNSECGTIVTHFKLRRNGNTKKKG